MEITGITAIMLRHMLKEPKQVYYCNKLSKDLDQWPGTLSPLLRRLEDAGWLSSETKRIGADVQVRRYYRFTRDGLRNARDELETWEFTDG